MLTRAYFDFETGQQVVVPLTAGEIAELATIQTPDPVPVIDAIDLWQRASDEEAEAIEGYMAQAPARVRNIFRVANTFRGDHELFGLLKDAAETLFSPERAAALLVPSRYE